MANSSRGETTMNEKEYVGYLSDKNHLLFSKQY